MQNTPQDDVSSAEKIPDAPVISKSEGETVDIPKTEKPLRMSGMCAIVTGGSKGIGAGVCMVDIFSI